MARSIPNPGRSVRELTSPESRFSLSLKQPSSLSTFGLLDTWTSDVCQAGSITLSLVDFDSSKIDLDPEQLLSSASGWPCPSSCCFGGWAISPSSLSPAAISWWRGVTLVLAITAAMINWCFVCPSHHHHICPPYHNFCTVSYKRGKDLFHYNSTYCISCV